VTVTHDEARRLVDRFHRALHAQMLLNITRTLSLRQDHPGEPAWEAAVSEAHDAEDMLLRALVKEHTPASPTPRHEPGSKGTCLVPLGNGMVCGEAVYDSRGGTVCRSGHGGGPFLPPWGVAG
jgi:hypothetical protein